MAERRKEEANELQERNREEIQNDRNRRGPEQRGQTKLRENRAHQEEFLSDEDVDPDDTDMDEDEDDRGEYKIGVVRGQLGMTVRMRAPGRSKVRNRNENKVTFEEDRLCDRSCDWAQERLRKMQENADERDQMMLALMKVSKEGGIVRDEELEQMKQARNEQLERSMKMEGSQWQRLRKRRSGRRQYEQQGPMRRARGDI